MEIKYKDIQTTTKMPIYVAYDGKEFNDSHDCMEYENAKYFNNINYRFNDMALYHTDGGEMFVQYSSEDDDVVVVVPKNSDDISFLNEIMVHHNGKNCKKLCDEHIGKYILCEYSDWRNDGIMNVDWFGWETIEEHIANFTKAMQNAIKCADELQILKNDIGLKKK